MKTITISLPQSMKEFIDARVADEGFSSVSEYVRALVRERQKQEAAERLDALLGEGVRSGEAIEVTPAYWEQKKRTLLEGRDKKRRG